MSNYLEQGKAIKLWIHICAIRLLPAGLVRHHEQEPKLRRLREIRRLPAAERLQGHGDGQQELGEMKKSTLTMYGISKDEARPKVLSVK